MRPGSFSLMLNGNGQTDGPTDIRTDIPSYRDARTHLIITYLAEVVSSSHVLPEYTAFPCRFGVIREQFSLVSMINHQHLNEAYQYVIVEISFFMPSVCLSFVFLHFLSIPLDRLSSVPWANFLLSLLLRSSTNARAQTHTHTHLIESWC